MLTKEGGTKEEEEEKQGNKERELGLKSMDLVLTLADKSFLHRPRIIWSSQVMSNNYRVHLSDQNRQTHSKAGQTERQSSKSQAGAQAGRTKGWEAKA